MSLDVTVRTLAPQPIVSITTHVTVDQLDRKIRDGLKTLYTLIEAQGGSPAGAPLGIYHGPIGPEEAGPIEVCVPVQQPLKSAGEVVARELPGGTIASVMMNGDQCDYPAILQGYDAVHDWIRKNGYKVAESPREIWHSEPGEEARMEIAWRFHESAE